MKYTIYLVIIPIFIFMGCSSKFEKISSSNKQKTSFSLIEGFYEDNLSLSYSLFKENCKKLKSNATLRDVCEKTEDEDINPYTFFTENFTPYILIDENENDLGTITGYYEPILKGSLVKDEIYKYPIYELPKYKISDTRKEINKRNDLKAICYLNSQSDLYLLHLQGSGKVKLSNGNILNLIYSGSNGKTSSSIGRYMIENNYIESNKATIQGVKKFLDDNPDKIDEILNQNERYIFFKVSDESLKGSLGLDLSAKRTIAVDKNYIDLGLPVFIQTKNPITKEPINRLVLANDTGDAIKGKIRADYFWGSGDEALKYAGRMKEKGRLIILIPKWRLF